MRGSLGVKEKIEKKQIDFIERKSSQPSQVKTCEYIKNIVNDKKVYNL